MKVLWLCNLIMPKIAEQLHIEASNKEGWITGLADVVMQNRGRNHIELAAAFPVPESLLEDGAEYFAKTLQYDEATIECYGFREDTAHPEIYDEKLEERLAEIVKLCKPDMVHCFGTEYPHTLAMCKVFLQKERLLITIQGLCSVYANVYFADLPSNIVNRVTFRDFLKRDSLKEQQAKYAARGEYEIAAVKLAGNVGGRTPWDKFYTNCWNPDAAYYVMGETLRSDFYETKWEASKARPHSIFVSQGNYPIKGLHYLLLAMPDILEKYPDATVYVAGDNVTEYSTLKQKIKIGSYGKYLRKLMHDLRLEDKVCFLGRLTGEQMKEQYLANSLFVCPSAIENSPNSLGEAMILGMPCVSADVGGIPGIFADGEDGILYEGCRSTENAFDNRSMISPTAIADNAHNLAEAVLRIWDPKTDVETYRRNSIEHAMRNHDREHNYENTVAVYTDIVRRAEEIK